MSSGSEQDLRRRFDREPPSATTNHAPPSLPPPDSLLAANPPSLPPLRSLAPPRPVGMPHRGPSSRAHRGSRFAHRYWHHPRRVGYEDFNRSMEERTRYFALLNSATGAPALQPAFAAQTMHGHSSGPVAAPPMHGPYHAPPPPSLPPLLPLPSAPPIARPDSPTDDHHRGSKRRKIETDRLPLTFKGFKYGKYGQVEPGELTMQIASCDGGLYSNESLYAAENILKNDSSVYCTKGNRCNIVLQHQGTTVFSLKELIIRAPGSNYSSPVREGMVFVSMYQDERLSRTARYQIQYVAPPQSPPSAHQEVHSSYALSDRPTHGHTRRDHHYFEQRQRERRQTARLPPEFTSTVTAFRITTQCSNENMTLDDSDDDDDNNNDHDHDNDDQIGQGEENGGGGGWTTTSTRRWRRHQPPDRIESLPFESDSSDDGIDLFESIPWAHATAVQAAGGGGPVPVTAVGMAGGDPTAPEGPVSLDEAQVASQIATQEAVRAVGGELLSPLAHFNMEKNKNKCTISFDPPVTGRFILLKMWNPQLDPTGNIDIQGVTARGYAGPRYFPAVEMR